MKRTFFPLVCAVFLCVNTASLRAQPAPAHDLYLQLDPARSAAHITLTGNFHSVEGSFSLKRGSIHYDPAAGKTSGEIVFDATSGNTGNDGRDNKMHKSVIESVRFPEITFHPDQAEGVLSTSGASTLQVHGMFGIHGGEHEITIPVEMHVEGNTWTAEATFEIPYAKWGMKNPSVVFLRVAGFVSVQLHAAGSLRPESR